MSRISFKQMFMQIARTVSLRSTCYRLNVGAVLVVGNHILSTGYNGAPSGRPHCGGDQCDYFDGKACSVLHAEENAFTWCPKGLQATDIFVTHSPCMKCAQLIVESAVSRVYFETAYRDLAPVSTLINAGKDVFRLTPSGYQINMLTQEMEAA